MSDISVSDIIVLLMPVMVAVAWWLFRWLEQRLPEKQRVALEYFARIAVKSIEHQYDDKSEVYKKNQATTLIYGLFQAFRLPLPSHIAIDAAVISIMWEISQTKHDTMLNTGPIKAVPPPPDTGGTPA